LGRWSGSFNGNVLLYILYIAVSFAGCVVGTVTSRDAARKGAIVAGALYLTALPACLLAGFEGAMLIILAALSAVCAGVFFYSAFSRKKVAATGKGQKIYSDGRFYEGDMLKGKPHGTGKMTYYSGNVYEGAFANGEPHGKGHKIYAEGDAYEGDFAKGTLNGSGKYTYANGDVYEGDFVDGNSHGMGKATYADGRVEEGQFENGEYKGK
jgi:hypothetical protein